MTVGRTGEFIAAGILLFLAVLLFLTPIWIAGFAFLIPALILLYLGLTWKPEHTDLLAAAIAGGSGEANAAVVRFDQNQWEAAPSSVSVIYLGKPAQPNPAPNPAPPGQWTPGAATDAGPASRSPVMARCSYCEYLYDITQGKCPRCGAGL